MVYLGGKTRLGAKIAWVLKQLREGRDYVEPFVGAAGVTVHIPGARAAGDADPDIIALWQAAQQGWVPPTTLSEAEYQDLKRNCQAPAHLRAFAKYACSWGGKPWGGYARGNREYARLGSVSVVRKAALLQGCQFHCQSYADWYPENALVYCDPPYKGVTGYSRAFDHVAFWDVVRSWSAGRNNVVVVSEYKAPDDFEDIAEFPLLNKLNGTAPIERLFVRRGFR